MASHLVWATCCSCTVCFAVGGVQVHTVAVCAQLDVVPKQTSMIPTIVFAFENGFVGVWDLGPPIGEANRTQAGVKPKTNVANSIEICASLQRPRGQAVAAAGCLDQTLDR